MATETRRPTGDGDVVGTWTYSSGSTGWNLVDEVSADDADYIVSPTTGTPSYQFTFGAFTVPAGSTINSLTVYVRTDDSGGTNSIAARLKIGGTAYNHGTPINPASAYTDYSFAFATNPATSIAWAVDDINGTGANPLQQVGLYSADPNPAIYLSHFYAVVDYTEGAAGGVPKQMSYFLRMMQ